MERRFPAPSLSGFALKVMLMDRCIVKRASFFVTPSGVRGLVVPVPSFSEGTRFFVGLRHSSR